MIQMVNITFILTIVAIILVFIDIILTLIKINNGKSKTDEPRIVYKDVKGKKFCAKVKVHNNNDHKYISEELLKQIIEFIRDNTKVTMHNDTYKCEFWLYSED